jgi:hypothetical protein
MVVRCRIKTFTDLQGGPEIMMRSNAFPKVYRSFEEFERDELRKLDGLHVSIDDMLDEMFADELDFEPGAKKNQEDDDE